METPRRMVIDEVATILGTERRRVYDIINVLESLNMAARVQKNMYQWMGKLYLEETLGRLKAIAVKLNLRAQVQALHTSGGEGDFKVGHEEIWFCIHLYSGKLQTEREKIHWESNARCEVKELLRHSTEVHVRGTTWIVVGV